MSKNVGGTTTNHIWDGTNIAAETTSGVINTYTYDMTGIHSFISLIINIL